MIVVGLVSGSLYEFEFYVSGYIPFESASSEDVNDFSGRFNIYVIEGAQTGDNGG